MTLRGRPPADAAVALAVRGGGCQAAFAFHFYRAPQPLRVRPSHGPRYGSFALTVELEGGLQALSLRQARDRTWRRVLHVSGQTLCWAALVVKRVHARQRRRGCRLQPAGGEASFPPNQI